MLTGDLGKIIDYLKEELVKLRAGRASIELVEKMKIEAYDTKMPLNQLATLTVPEPRLILIQPWDKSLLKNIESALRANLPGLNPIVDSALIRIPFPAPTEERRRELVKEVGKIIETAKIRIRRAREEAVQELEEKEDKKEISEDALFRQKDEIQRTVDEYNKKVDEVGARKEEEILTI